MNLAPCPLGRKIARIREEMGFTQQQMAASLSRSQAWVSMVESGRKRLSAAMLRRVAQFLKVSVGELIRGTDWTRQDGRPSAGGRKARLALRRKFRGARGCGREPGSVPAELHVRYTPFALQLARQARQGGDTNWRKLRCLSLQTTGETQLVNQLLSLARVEYWSPLELGCCALIAAGPERNYSGHIRRWALRISWREVEVVVMSQMPVLGRSGQPHRLDFLVGAANGRRTVWLGVEVDESFHTEKVAEDQARDADLPLEVMRFAEPEVYSPAFRERFFGEICRRLQD